MRDVIHPRRGGLLDRHPVRHVTRHGHSDLHVVKPQRALFDHGLLAHVAESKLSTAEDTGDAEEKSRFEQVRTSYPPCPPWWRGNLNRTRGAFLCLTQSPLT